MNNNLEFKDIPVRLKSQRVLESMLENLDGFERDLSEFETLVERYNTQGTHESLELMTDKQYEIMRDYHINNEKQFKALHLEYQVKLMEEE